MSFLGADDDVPELAPPLDLRTLDEPVNPLDRPQYGGLAGAPNPNPKDFAELFGGPRGAREQQPEGTAADQSKTKKKGGTRAPSSWPKLDAARLLSAKGLPRLKELSTKVRFKGKGHEVEDLQKLITFYQIWGHELYPSAPFRQVVEKTEKVCHERQLKVFLSSVIAEERRQRMGISAQHDEHDGFGVGDDVVMAEAGDGDVHQADNQEEPSDPLGLFQQPAQPAHPTQSIATPTPHPSTDDDPSQLRLSGTSSTLSDEVLNKIQASRAKALEKLAERQRQREQERLARVEAERAAEEQKRREEEEKRIAAMIAEAPMFVDED
ncbi:hypothetical protein HK097_000732 [Rhizophlyctis rosea]|uniref:Chromosome segregation in meiosis protein n=1 Tax=Rhizophlyctis rosea TaxID=64517 RepID=A0AAD5X4J7_9FUNG|nr:hypothetical protein HK097_000732 [Rhizophlyctis rosea]